MMATSHHYQDNVEFILDAINFYRQFKIYSNNQEKGITLANKHIVSLQNVLASNVNLHEDNELFENEKLDILSSLMNLQKTIHFFQSKFVM